MHNIEQVLKSSQCYACDSRQWEKSRNLNTTNLFYGQGNDPYSYYQKIRIGKEVGSKIGITLIQCYHYSGDRVLFNQLQHTKSMEYCLNTLFTTGDHTGVNS